MEQIFGPGRFLKRERGAVRSPNDDEDDDDGGHDWVKVPLDAHLGKVAVDTFLKRNHPQAAAEVAN